MSPVRDLKVKYGNTKSRDVINRAIRAECPGGDLALDRLADWNRICNRLGWGNSTQHGTGSELLHVTAYRHILEIVDAMEDAIRARYDMSDRPVRDDLKR